jgi:hypothetical protein
MQQQVTETGVAIAAKVAPPVAVVGVHWAGITVPDAIQWLTLIYVMLMVVHKAWHMLSEYKTGKQYPVREDEFL